MLSIFCGLFLLGILLYLRKLNDNYCIWGCVGLHGGLVGIWFLLRNGLLEISEDAPSWIIGPGNLNPNPLGGFYGISILLMFCMITFLNRTKRIKKNKFLN